MRLRLGDDKYLHVINATDVSRVTVSDSRNIILITASFINMVINILKGITFEEMPICDKDFNIIKYELLTRKVGFNTTMLMQYLDEISGKKELFKKVFSKCNILLEEDRDKGLSINIGKEELLDKDIITYLIENNIFSIRTDLEVTEGFFGESEEEIENNTCIIIEHLGLLHYSGYSIYIDDFGVEGSNKERVDLFMEFLTGIKLDKEIYNDLESYKEYFAGLIKKGITITGEWVIDKEIKEKLEEVGATAFQGDLFKKEVLKKEK